jgi:hypothetical protein
MTWLPSSLSLQVTQNPRLSKAALAPTPVWIANNYVPQGTNGNVANPVTLTVIPTTAQVGDILILLCMFRGHNAGTGNPITSGLAGFTYYNHYSAGSGNATVAVYWKVHDGDMTWPDHSRSTTTAAQVSVHHILILRGISASTPIAEVGTRYTNTSTGSSTQTVAASVPGITIANNSVAIAITVTGATTWNSINNLSTGSDGLVWTEAFDQVWNFSGGGQGCCSAAYGINTLGNITLQNKTLTSVNASTDYHCVSFIMELQV